MDLPLCVSNKHIQGQISRLSMAWLGITASVKSNLLRFLEKRIHRFLLEMACFFTKKKVYMGYIMVYPTNLTGL
jgi:hypothetical protein